MTTLLRRIHFNQGAPATGGSDSGTAAASTTESGGSAGSSSTAESAASSSTAPVIDAFSSMRAQALGEDTSATATATTTTETATTTETTDQGGQGQSSTTDAATQEAQRQQDLLRRYGPVLERLERDGYSDAGAIEAHLTQQQEQSAQQTAFANHMQAYQEKLIVKVEADKITEAEAYEEYDAEVERQKQVFAARSITAKHAQMEAETAMTAAMETHPVLKVGRSADGKTMGAGEKLVRSLAKSNPDLPLTKIAEYVAGSLTTARDMAVADHTAKNAETQAKPPILNGGGNGGGQGSGGRPMSFTEKLFAKAGIFQDK